MVTAGPLPCALLHTVPHLSCHFSHFIQVPESEVVLFYFLILLKFFASQVCDGFIFTFIIENAYRVPALGLSPE